MDTKITVLGGMALAVLVVAGCNKPSDQDNNGNVTTNVGSTNLMYPNSMVTNDLYTNSVATNMATAAGGTWQSTKEAGATAWSDTKTAATNAWQATGTGASNVLQETKEISTNAWEKTKEAFGSVGASHQFSTNYFAYDYSMKDNFVSEAQTNLNYLDSRISSLSDMADNGSNTNADFQQAVQEVKNKRASLGVEYDAVKSATADTWDDAKTAYAKSYYDLTATLKAASDTASVNM